MAKTAIPGAKRGTKFMVPPESLIVVTEAGHPLYHKRASRPLRENMIASVKKFGVRVAIKVRRNGETWEVVDGRGRTRCAVEANRRLVAEGLQPMFVPVEVEHGTDETHRDMMEMLNHQRDGDSPVELAEKLAQYLACHTPEDAEVVFGIGKAMQKHYLGLLDMAAPVQAAVHEGRLTIQAAERLAGSKNREEQEKAVAELPPPAPTGRPRRQRNALKPTKKRAASVAEMLDGVAREAVLWVLGELSAGDVESLKLRSAIEATGKTVKVLALTR